MSLGAGFKTIVSAAKLDAGLQLRCRSSTYRPLGYAFVAPPRPSASGFSRGDRVLKPALILTALAHLSWSMRLRLRRMDASPPSGLSRRGFPILVLLVAGLSVGSPESQAGQLLIEEAAHYRDVGRQHQEAGQIDQAIDAYNKATLSYPEYAEAHNDLGILYEAKGDLAKAEAAYLRALQVDPRHPSAHMNLALLYEAQGKVDQAAGHWQARVEIGPADNPWVRRAREALIRYRLKVPEPQEMLDAKRRGQVALAYEEGMFYLNRKRWAEAQEVFQRVLALDPKHRGAQDGLRAAQRRLSRGPTVSGPQRQAAGQLAQTLAREKKRAQAPTPRPAVAATPTRPPATVMPTTKPPPTPTIPVPPPARPAPIAPALKPAAPAPVPKLVSPPLVSTAAVISTPREAKALAEQLAREKQRTRDVMVRELFQRGLILHRQEQYAQAVEQFQRALTIDPDHRESQQYLREAQAALARGQD